MCSKSFFEYGSKRHELSRHSILYAFCVTDSKAFMILFYALFVANFAVAVDLTHLYFLCYRTCGILSYPLQFEFHRLGGEVRDVISVWKRCLLMSAAQSRPSVLSLYQTVERWNLMGIAVNHLLVAVYLFRRIREVFMESSST